MDMMEVIIEWWRTMVLMVIAVMHYNDYDEPFTIVIMMTDDDDYEYDD